MVYWIFYFTIALEAYKGPSRYLLAGRVPPVHWGWFGTHAGLWSYFFALAGACAAILSANWLEGLASTSGSVRRIDKRPPPGMPEIKLVEFLVVHGGLPIPVELETGRRYTWVEPEALRTVWKRDRSMAIGCTVGYSIFAVLASLGEQAVRDPGAKTIAALGAACCILVLGQSLVHAVHLSVLLKSLDLTVRMDGGKLIAESPGQSDLPLRLSRRFVGIWAKIFGPIEFYRNGRRTVAIDRRLLVPVDR